jgi:hypothetical protein
MQNNSTMLVPMPQCGTREQIDFTYVECLRDLGGDVFFALWQRWPSFDARSDLPLGHELYVISFHLEPLDIDWLLIQSGRLGVPVIVLSDSEHEDFPWPDNVHQYQYYHWHHQIDTIKRWFPTQVSKNINYKASAFCNRITQSKLWIFTALVEYLGDDHCLLKLDDWLEEKNVHHREHTGQKELDNLADMFWKKYWGQKYKIDSFDNITQNHQSFTADPLSRAYRESAINFTNESFHYSLMDDHIVPGPFLTEKTLKCLVGGTAFVPVGQYNTYGSLGKLGLKFEYGFDLSWDNDPGNLTRMRSIVDFIRQMSKYTAQELFEITAVSTVYNKDMVWSGEFRQRCQIHNDLISNTILSRFGR